MDDYLKTIERRLKRFPGPEAKVLGDWLRDKPVGINLALQFLEQIADLQKMTGQAPSILLAELLEEVSAKNLSSKELGRRLRDALDRRLHPQRYTHEMAFAAWQKRLGLPQGLCIKAPQNSEGKTFILQIEFSTSAGLRESLRSLEQALEHQTLWEELTKF